MHTHFTFHCRCLFCAYRNAHSRYFIHCNYTFSLRARKSQALLHIPTEAAATAAAEKRNMNEQQVHRAKYE